MELEQEFDELTGTIESIIYKNDENGYTVLRLRDDSGELQTVVGCFPYAAVGESLIVSGSWVTHATHGKQFKAEFSQRILPTTAPAIYEYLAGGVIKGLGPATASLIVNRFGERSLDILENHPEKLAEIKGISYSKAEQMSNSFRRQAGTRRLMEYVCSFGLRPVLAMRMYKFYGDEALNMLRQNPYVLASAHIGGNFAEADRMALESGVDAYGENRICAAILFEMVYNSGFGHCFIPREKLAAATGELLGMDPQMVDDCIEILIETGQLMYEEIVGCRACYLPELYNAEVSAAALFARMGQTRYDDRADIPRLVSELEKRLGIKYAPSQIETLRLALNNQLVVLTGGPGTGKTTSIRAILAMFDSMGIKTLLAAPTGRASKRMTELTGREASTVHRLLEAKFSEDGENVVFAKDENNRLECEAVILDESSMMDIVLMDALLRALPSEARLIMVGDMDQLPSVGPGNVFSALVRSGVAPTVRLTEIFRQNGESNIIRNAHMINRGEHPNLAENKGDFFRLKRLQAASTVETITELCSVRLPGKMNIPPEDIQVLAPTRKGELGTVSLNKNLQMVLNPPNPAKKEKLFGDVVFREGDKVMQIRNNYDIIWHTYDNRVSGTGMFNGDIGRILSIEPEAEQLTVDFDGKVVTYGFDSLPELEHAWAMTVHKSQGSEYRAVILALSPAAPMLLTRGVLYTAVTRARELLILVGDEQTAYQMIDSTKQDNRYTALRVRLRKNCGLE